MTGVIYTIDTYMYIYMFQGSGFVAPPPPRVASHFQGPSFARSSREQPGAARKQPGAAREQPGRAGQTRATQVRAEGRAGQIAKQ